MYLKIIALTLFLAFSSNYIEADAWPEKECNKLSGYVGFLSAASAGSLEEATEAKKKDDEDLANKKFMAAHMLSEQAANFSKVYSTFCDLKRKWDCSLNSVFTSTWESNMCTYLI